MEQFIWLGLMILFLVVEALTVGLTSVWFAGGALAAMLTALAGAAVVWQIVVFLAVSSVLVILTRPLAMKYFNSKKEKTNYESNIGKVVQVTERIDNLCQTGSAKVGGQEWTARSTDDKVILEEGTLAKVVEIQGVKLIVEPYREKENAE